MLYLNFWAQNFVAIISMPTFELGTIQFEITVSVYIVSNCRHEKLFKSVCKLFLTYSKFL